MPRATKPNNRAGTQLNVWIEDGLAKALAECTARNRRTKTEEVSIALEEYLAKQGLWPKRSGKSGKG